MDRDDAVIEKIHELHAKAKLEPISEESTVGIFEVALEHRNPDSWAQVDLTALSETDRRRFERLAKAITGYIAHGNKTIAAREAGVARSTFSAQVRRCFTRDGAGGILGWAGLMRNQRIAHYQRTADLPSEGGSDKGAGGAFQMFLASHRTLRTELDEFILPTGDSSKPRSARPSKARVFSHFKKLCVKHGIQANEYPLCSKSQGRRSVERYVTQKLQAQPEAAAAFYFGEAAARRMNLQTGRKSGLFKPAPLVTATIDAHRFDCHCTIELDGPAGPQPVLITRLWLITVIDVGSRCVMGFAIVIREEVSAADVEKAILRATTRWEPKALSIPGIEFADGAGLPYGVVEGLPPFAPARLQMDNAAVHYATRIIETTRRALGCVVAFVPISAWWKNAIHERWHRQLESLGIQRITSSAGNSPSDPLKRDGMANAIKHRVRMQDIEELADVLIANFNATPTEALGNRSPLDVLRYGISMGHILPRTRAELPPFAPQLGVTIMTRVVRGNQKKGCRPYVELDKVRYTSPELSSRFDLIGATLVLHVKDSAYTSVKAFTQDGIYLGVLDACGAWSRPHTREQRKAINALKDIGAVSCDVGGDVVEAYHDLLLERAREAARSAPKKTNPAATVAARVGRDAGLPSTKSSASVSAPPAPSAPPPQRLRAVPEHLSMEIDFGSVR